uniref:Parvo_NS1 domain-containing protein n=1 Tax=Rhodnius prolixus TaxID=13249 RepID=T1HE18_RHOPR
MTAHTPTKAVAADLSTQFNNNIKEVTNNTITDESSDEETSNVYPITSGIHNIIQRWKGANGSQRRSMATPGASLVQVRIMPYQQAKTMDPTKRYKCTKRYAQDCPRRNLLIFDEPNVEPMALENFKLLFAGTPTPANIKYESQNLINRTPVIVTCNRDPFPKTPEFQKRIRRIYWAQRIDNNIKQLTVEIHPLGLFQLLTNTSTANIPPQTDDDIIEYDFGTDYPYMHAT